MKEKTKKEIYSWLISIGISLAVVFVIRTFLFEPTVVNGESMQPTFYDSDMVIVSKISDIERFDIIVFEAPDADVFYVKRVIGLPGDTIEVRDNLLYVNGKYVEEPYLESHQTTRDFTLEQLTGEESVPDDSFFVLGDNRVNSNDSRFFGYVTSDAVVGEVRVKIFPFNVMGLAK